MTLIRSCPVCGTPTENSKLFLQENIDYSRITDSSYSSRKNPEYMCYRLICCSTCELLYASNPPEQKELARSYHLANFDSSDEANDAAHSYIESISPIFSKLKTKKSVLEIGAGTGVFLELLRDEGFDELVGVEPSLAAISTAPVHRLEWLRMGIFDENLFPPESFDLICCFMTMEHVREPMNIASGAWRLLKPGGAFITVTHDYKSLINRILGKRSPIIDIEHMQLFTRNSIFKLFKLSGFVEIETFPLINRYSLDYWIRLSPIPKLLKYALQSINAATGLGRYKIGLNVGNSITVGFRVNEL